MGGWDGTGLDPDRLFPVDPRSRDIARALHAEVAGLPILSPHGHTDPRWYAENAPFPDPARLFVTPDHYVFRMLHSQGVPLEALGVPRADGGPVETDGRRIWRLLAENFHLFRGTPSRLWLEHTFQEVFGLGCGCRPRPPTSSTTTSPTAWPARSSGRARSSNASASRRSPRPRARSTTCAGTALIRDSGWSGRVVTAYRPDAVLDPEFDGFAGNVARLGELTGCDTGRWDGYLEAHRVRRAFFKDHGATSTDHGHPTARTEDLSRAEAAALFAKALRGECTPEEADAFRGHMLTEMARMSLDDGLVLQIHPGSWRNHSAAAFARFGRDKGFDIPTRTDYVRALKPLLDAVGDRPELTIILFTLDESAYARELAPLAGVYPALRLGPAWWFFDSPEGMRRFRELTTETAGFYNTVGFNDDTRAFCSIPARHDMARRVDCAYLATLVATGRLSEDEAPEVARDLAYRLAKQAYRL